MYNIAGQKDRPLTAIFQHLISRTVYSCNQWEQM